MKIIKVIPFITTLMLMFIIFSFSAQNSIESSRISKGITEKIVNILPVVRNMSLEEKQNIVTNIHGVMRKCAHFLLYSALGFSAAAMFMVINPEKRMLYIWFYAIIFSALYAATDEFHQLFVAGRSGQISDIFIDSSGGMIGGGGFVIVKKIFDKIINKTRNRL